MNRRGFGENVKKFEGDKEKKIDGEEGDGEEERERKGLK